MATIYDWSTTAGNNATADADINWSEGMFPSVVNDSARQMMGRLAEYVGDNGIRVAAGTANAITVSTNAAITVPPQGMTVAFKALATNTGAVTLGLNGGAGLRLRKVFAGNTDATDLDSADITAKGVYIAHYDQAANSGAGAWLLINPTNNTAIQSLIVSMINAASTKNTPGDSDAVIITDSADGNKSKRVLWSRIKSVLKEYFDSIYQAALGFTPANKAGDTFTGSVIVQQALRTMTTFAAGGTANGRMGFYNSNGVYIGEMGVAVNTGSGDAIGFYNALGANWTINNSLTVSNSIIAAIGSITAATRVYAGAGTGVLTEDGNLIGSVWSPWGSNNALSAIESRVNSVATARANAVQANIVPTMAALSAGAVGTYAMLYYTQTGSVGAGGLNGGGAFSWSSAWGNSNIGAPTGAWRCMGYCDSNTQSARVTLHMRYA